MQTPEDFAWEVLASDDFVLTPHEVLTALIRARDAEVRADNPAVRAWVEPGINPPYHERAKARVRKIMPLLARHLDEQEKEKR